MYVPSRNSENRQGYGIALIRARNVCLNDYLV